MRLVFSRPETTTGIYDRASEKRTTNFEPSIGWEKGTLADLVRAAIIISTNGRSRAVGEIKENGTGRGV